MLLTSLLVSTRKLFSWAMSHPICCNTNSGISQIRTPSYSSFCHPCQSLNTCLMAAQSYQCHWPLGPYHPQGWWAICQTPPDWFQHWHVLSCSSVSWSSWKWCHGTDCLAQVSTVTVQLAPGTTGIHCWKSPNMTIVLPLKGCLSFITSEDPVQCLKLVTVKHSGFINHEEFWHPDDIS